VLTAVGLWVYKLTRSDPIIDAQWQDWIQNTDTTVQQMANSPPMRGSSFTDEKGAWPVLGQHQTNSLTSAKFTLSNKTTVDLQGRWADALAPTGRSRATTSQGQLRGGLHGRDQCHGEA